MRRNRHSYKNENEIDEEIEKNVGSECFDHHSERSSDYHNGVTSKERVSKDAA